MIYQLPTRNQNHSIFYFYSFEAVVLMQERTHKVRKSASRAVVGRMQLALHTARGTLDGEPQLWYQLHTPGHTFF